MSYGFLVEFPRVVNGVHFAHAIRRPIRVPNARVPENTRMELRIGVDTSDVIIEDDDIHGDDVNIAARLEGMCEPGTVCVSRTFYGQVIGKLEAAFEDLAEQTVKSIAKSVRVEQSAYGHRIR
jgi:adenylate cyclase